jgi:hypothetical protein
MSSSTAGLALSMICSMRPKTPSKTSALPPIESATSAAQPWRKRVENLEN